jgi:hypothetical protein
VKSEICKVESTTGGGPSVEGISLDSGPKGLLSVHQSSNTAELHEARRGKGRDRETSLAVHGDACRRLQSWLVQRCDPPHRLERDTAWREWIRFASAVEEASS